MGRRKHKGTKQRGRQSTVYSHRPSQKFNISCDAFDIPKGIFLSAPAQELSCGAGWVSLSDSATLKERVVVRERATALVIPKGRTGGLRL